MSDGHFMINHDMRMRFDEKVESYVDDDYLIFSKLCETDQDGLISLYHSAYLCDEIFSPLYCDCDEIVESAFIKYMGNQNEEHEHAFLEALKKAVRANSVECIQKKFDEYAQQREDERNAMGHPITPSEYCY